MNFVFLLLSTICISFANSMSKLDAMKYLQHYGYMPSIDESTFHQALIRFQNYTSLAMTGEMDDATNKMMEIPRCGCPDKTRIRSERFTIQGSKWRLKNIAYSISYLPTVKQSIMDKSVRGAYREWSKHTGISFSQTSKRKADVQVTFGVLGFADNCPTLGIAQYPIFGGNIMLNNNVTWTAGTASGFNMFQVVLHEIGHTLGLGHSKVKDSVMWPMFKEYNPDFKLSPDDIEGIQLLYPED